MKLVKSTPKKTVLALAIAAACTAFPCFADDDEKGFQRIATFPVYLNTDINQETVAEIVAASADGMTLIYTDGKTENLGFVDITDPAKPLPAGVVALGGEPTSVAVKGAYALAAVNTSTSFTEPSGNLQVIDIASGELKATFDLGGQPDSIAVSPDGRYAAIVIENERDEDAGDGAPPQAPAGFFVIVDMLGEPADWTRREVNLTTLDGMHFASDPEPEYVDINSDNIAVVTLQENNHIALIDLVSGDIVNHFSAGTVDLDQVDTEKDGSITLDSELLDIPREPDGVSWISNTQFVTADEGDLDGGSRGFTIFNTDGSVAHAPGNSVEHAIVRHGHFPDKRAGKKGNEPENAEFAQYGDDKLLFVGSERASVVLVYKVKDDGKADKHNARKGSKHKGHELVQLKQVLATATKPEGLLAIPQRNLFVAAGEADDRGDKIRSGLSIYQLSDEANYPTVVSKDRADGTPIPWGALSGLAMDPEEEDTAYTIQDSFYKQSRVLKLDIEETPAKITQEIVLKDANGQLAAIDPSLVNADGTVNLDPEGIATRTDGGFWIASEGKGTIGDTKKPFESLDLLLRVAKHGLIEEVVTLPETVNERQVRFGFEGVVAVDSEYGEQLYVAFQREWAGDADGHVRIGRYNTDSGEWDFYYYPIDAPQSANGGWVGLSDITYLGDDKFAVIERDNQGGPDAAIKRLYTFSIDGLTPTADDGSAPSFPVLSKTLLRDLMGDLAATGGLTLEKVEGLAVTEQGTLLVVNDNDGVDDSNGETQLLRIEGVFK
ncbi:MAG: esterase-like activity of phytase family protein [Gammaproteobacteria bacterium]|nr:esterase-like activity of phytase family protein [Gammaproteobacteria bacterium]MBQ0838511.1 esterase-like activity of phytase family protein [Gammaproteobacteria bacterium]